MTALALKDCPDWPAAMNRDAALAYTSVAETQMKEWVKRGLVRFQPRGPNGAMLCRRVDLDAALEAIFISGSPEDLDVG